MGNINRTGALILIGVIAISCLSIGSVKPTNAQSIPKPSVPDFTVKYVDRSYYVAPVYGVDPYSGKTVQTGGGFTVTNKTLEVTILSQSFTPYVFTGDDGLPHEPSMEWDLAYKGHFGDDWTFVSQGPPWNESSGVIVFGVGTEYQNQPRYLPASLGDQVDFKVRARIGYNTIKEGHSFTDPDALAFHGETSDWSSIKTVTVGDNTNFNTPNPTSTISPTPPIPTSTPIITPAASEIHSNSTEVIALPMGSFAVIVALIVLLAVAVVVLALKNRGRTAKLEH